MLSLFLETGYRGLVLAPPAGVLTILYCINYPSSDHHSTPVHLATSPSLHSDLDSSSREDLFKVKVSIYSRWERLYLLGQVLGRLAGVGLGAGAQPQHLVAAHLVDRVLQ